MAGPSCLTFPELEEEPEVLCLDSIPYRYQIYRSDFHPSSPDHNFDSDLFDPICGTAAGISGSDSTDLFDRENRVNFVMDLLQQRVEQSQVLTDRNEFVSEPIHESSFNVVERNGEMCIDSLVPELGLGLDMDDDSCGGFVVSDCGDEFFVARRDSTTENPGNLVDEDRFSGGLTVVGIESDSEEDENDLLGIELHSEEEEEDDYAAENVNDDDIAIPLYLSSFQLEDHRDGNDDFEWEEVDDSVDGGEVLSVMVDPEEEESASVMPVTGSEEDGGGERERGLGNLDWAVLLNVANLERSLETENDDHGDYIYTAEYELMLGQFAGVENGHTGRPPASKSITENLPSTAITEEDVLKNNALCAVCKDEIDIGELAKQLPCSHRYHGNCILPWLGMRNTCPVCRFELPTDDPDYERWRIQRATHFP
ncbi:hypothetical protein Nepgr_023731 [Nepenthes gracilis]|uniref:RING-type E3 ubiquitin transferase n=1 Tax=Nepenthes gracilis TaxID=150966 RepID=A0AAD3T1H1_NEPGR|nr:hypothetical protein Nepgr_023731 [Nepenthes gracilis]